MDLSKAALVRAECELTFGELGDRAGRVAHALRALGASDGERVAVMLPNGMEFFEVSLGAAGAGCPVVPVNWHLKEEEVAWLLEDSEARVIVVHADFAETARQAVSASPSGGARILVVGASASGPDSYEAALAGAEAAPVEGQWAWPQYVYYTSGTTGRPRGVEREGPPADTGRLHAAMAAMWGLTGDDVWLACSPLYHAAASYSFTTLAQGGTVVVMERWDAREWLSLVERHRVTACFMVPSHFIRLLEIPESERSGFDLSSLRLVLHAAAPCPVPVKRRILDALPTAEIWEFYGATEGGATRISGDEWKARPGSVGRPWPGVEILIVDADGQECATGKTGRIYIRPAGGSRFRYRNDPDKTGGAWLGDAFTVGDVGHVDEDGYLFITDRASDMVIRSGVNIYPAEIETVLHSHPAVVDCAVFGVPDPDRGEELKALVEVRSEVTVSELADYCRERIAAYKVPRFFEVVTTLPRDPAGKVLKRQLRDTHWGAARNAVAAD